MANTTNPYQLAYDSAYAATYPPASRSFHIRLWFQVASCCVLFLLCCLYLLLAFLNGKARNKKFYLIQIIKLPFGRLLVLNSLYLYVLFSGVSAIIIGFNQREHYLTTVKLHPTSSKAPWGLFVWLAPFLSAWVFVFPHIVATVKVRQQASAVESATTVWIWTHNAVCIGVAVIFYAVAIPVGYISSSKSSKLHNLGIQVVEQLRQIAQQYDEDPSGVAPTSLAKLAETQAEAGRVASQVWPWGKAMLGFMVAFLGVFAVAAAASYSFVMFLRKATRLRHNTTRALNVSGAAVHIVQEQVTSIEGPSPSAPLPNEPSKWRSARSAKPAVFTPSELAPANTTFAGLVRPATLSAGQVRAMNEAALVRLAKDLQTAIPLFVGMCLYFVIAGIIVIVKLPSASADSGWQAFLQDGFTLPYLVLTTITQSALIFNLLRNYTSPQSYPGHGSSARVATAGQFGSFKLAVLNRQTSFHEVRSTTAAATQGTPIQLDLSVEARDPFSSKADLEGRSEDKVYL